MPHHASPLVGGRIDTGAGAPFFEHSTKSAVLIRLDEARQTPFVLELLMPRINF